MIADFFAALTLQAGYNATLVAIGAGLLGASAGAAGAFLFLRKRALVSDAVAHATLPGVALAFLAMTAAGLDGRNLIGLLLGSAATAGLGLLAVDWLTRRTRLAEDAAIGAVLSVFFGAGVVLLPVIQNYVGGKQAGLEGFLLGSTAGMLFEDAVVIAVAGGLSTLFAWILRRPMTIVAFDQEYAASIGVSVRAVDLAMMALVMAVTVIGLKVVGLILIIAMLIIPSVAARFWTDRIDHLVLIAAAIGAASAYIGAALSAAAPKAPAGAVIVLTAGSIFLISMLFAPLRGLIAVSIKQNRFKQAVHRRQGLLSMARGEPILERYTLRLLRREGLIRPDGVPTDEGAAQAAKAARDEKRWEAARILYRDTATPGRYDGLTPISDVLTQDEIRALDELLGAPSAAT